MVLNAQAHPVESAPSQAELLAALTALIEPVLTAQGLELVRLTFSGGQRRTATLQVMAERPDGTMTVELCAAASHAISEALDTADPVEGDYVLEVSSPGIDRPLTRPGDYERWAGHEARLTLAAPLDGRKRLAGRLLGLEGDAIRMATQDGTVTVPMAAIASAKLVLTDALIKATRPALPAA